MKSIALAIVLLLIACPAFARKWTDATGKFSVEAELVKVSDNTVTLKKTDGATIDIALDKLSSDDRKFIQDYQAQEGTKKEADKTAADTTGFKYNDGTPDGEDHAIGNTKTIRFDLKTDGQKIGGIRVHASKYEPSNKADNKVVVNLLSADAKETLSTHDFPYSKFEVGKEKWVTLDFPEPVAVPKSFWVEIDDQADLYRELHISWDSSTTGHSRDRARGRRGRTGEPTAPMMLKPVFKGDYMIELFPAKAAQEK